MHFMEVHDGREAGCIAQLVTALEVLCLQGIVGGGGG